MRKYDHFIHTYEFICHFGGEDKINRNDNNRRVHS